MMYLIDLLPDTDGSLLANCRAFPELTTSWKDKDEPSHCMSSNPAHDLIGANTIRAEQDNLGSVDTLVWGVAIPREKAKITQAQFTFEARDTPVIMPAFSSNGPRLSHQAA